MPHARTRYLETLSRAVTAIHGCQCEHKRTAYVHEMADGRTVWEGDVEVFALYEHPTASKAFAWGYTGASGEMQYLAYLNEDSVLTPRDAVLAAVRNSGSVFEKR